LLVAQQEADEAAALLVAQQQAYEAAALLVAQEVAEKLGLEDLSDIF
jgi:hypothetical protein